MFESRPVFRKKETPVPKRQEVAPHDKLGQLKKRRAELLEWIKAGEPSPQADRVLMQKLDDEIAKLEGKPEKNK